MIHIIAFSTLKFIGFNKSLVALCIQIPIKLCFQSLLVQAYENLA